MSADNKSLGKFVLDGIAPAPRGVPQIEVTFNIDANGILNVTAKDKGTGKEQSITISGSGNLSKSDIEKAQREAEAHADEDKKKRELVDAKNTLAQTIYQAEKLPTEHKDKIIDDDKKVLEEAVKAAKEFEGSDDLDKVNQAVKDLNEKIMPIGAKLYEAAAQEAKPADETNPGDDKKADGPVEGEVVDEEKK
jgi:molecular chaperone DnaK